jgi:hypothetical protein
MKKICITLIMLSILMVAFALPCGADGNDSVIITIDFYGPTWDINNDGITDALDVSLLVAHYGEEGTPGWIPEDINKNGIVDAFDVSYLVASYGETWTIP